jgi:pimeloyl-ACP methyl ester carboxylesterase
MRETTHKITANGLVHAIRDSGEEGAPPAVLLHGFPDSSAVWNKITPLLVDGGFRVLAPDLRGFGDTDMAERIADYNIQTGAVIDIIAIMDTIGVARAHLVGHDFGAPVAWALAAQRPERFATLAALSVGHPRAFLKGGPEQRRRSVYILVHQLRGVCEWLYRRNNWALLRSHWEHAGDLEGTIARLARPGRLTAGLNWYRANIPLSRIFFPVATGAFGEEIVRTPTLGVWPSGDDYLVERQMTESKAFVDAPWSYARLDGASHWLQEDAPEALAALLLGHWRAYPAS